MENINVDTHKRLSKKEIIVSKMIGDMRGIATLEVEKKIAEELYLRGYRPPYMNLGVLSNGEH